MTTYENHTNRVFHSRFAHNLLHLCQTNSYIAELPHLPALALYVWTLAWHKNPTDFVENHIANSDSHLHTRITNHNVLPGYAYSTWQL